MKHKTCKTCKKMLPTTEFFKKEKSCVDCVAADDDGLIYCYTCRSWNGISMFTMTTMDNITAYRSKLCINCKSKKTKMSDAGTLRKKNNAKKTCTNCDGTATERDIAFNDGKLTDGLCSDCYLSEYNNDIQTIDTEIKKKSQFGCAGELWEQQ